MSDIVSSEYIDRIVKGLIAGLSEFEKEFVKAGRQKRAVRPSLA